MARTDDYRFIASSDQGAVGDVVAVEISLVIDELHDRLIAFSVIGCYDPEKAELLDPPLHSEWFDTVAYITNVRRLGEAPAPQSLDGESRGFFIDANLRSDVVDLLVEEGSPLPILTLFFRLKGEPGDSFQVRFCDEEFYFFGQPGSSCLRSYLYYVPSSAGQLVALSGRHVPGEVRILEGEATRLEPPDLPPQAKVYDEAPTPETANVLFEVTGAVAAPGETGVPIDLYITSGFEYSGYAVGLSFPPDALRLARVEERVGPGAVRIDNEAGGLGIVLQHSRRRIGAEGERVRIATLYFDVLGDAGGMEDVPIAFGPFGGFLNLVNIHTRRHGEVTLLPETLRVEPLRVVDGLLKIRRNAPLPFLRGDANGDTRVDIADAVATLGHLFLGDRELRCPDAADATDDGKLDLTDAVATLRFLFLGEGSIPPPWPDPGLDPTPDGLECAGGS